MARRYRTDWAGVLLVAGLVTFLAGVFGWAGLLMTTENKCLAAGYPSGKVTISMQRYCIKRVDQTDTVVPLAEALAPKAE